jgi:hypothetical protein
LCTLARVSGPHARYLWFQAIVGAVINFVLNGAIGWVLFVNKPPQPLWARGPSIASDTLGTSFFLPFITCLILTSVVRRDVAKGRVPALDVGQSPLAERAPKNRVSRGALIGVICLLTLGPVVVLGLGAAGFERMTAWQFIVFKASYSLVLAAIVSPVIALVALRGAAARVVTAS